MYAFVVTPPFSSSLHSSWGGGKVRGVSLTLWGKERGIKGRREGILLRSRRQHRRDATAITVTTTDDDGDSPTTAAAKSKIEGGEKSF
jgi:hypothetical protein